MAFRSLKSKLLAAVSALVIGSGLLISLLVTQRYSENLLAALTIQAENLAHAVALEAAEKVLTNDVVALQKMLDHQIKSNPTLAYLFVVREGHVLAHTFGKGFPVDLVAANQVDSEDKGISREIVSTQGDRFLDIAWPIFAGRAGVLRLGLSEKPLREQVRKLWLEITLLTLGILIAGLVGARAFVRRITRPLAELSAATQRIDQGDLDVRVKVHGTDEVAALGASFNQMVSRVRDYTGRLERQTSELERTNNQTRAFCEIVKDIGALPTLSEIGPVLIRKLSRIVGCGTMALVVVNEGLEALYVLSTEGARQVRDASEIRSVLAALEGTGSCVFFAGSLLSRSLMPDSFRLAARQAVVPIAGEHQLLGALLIACPGDCVCEFSQLDWVTLILAQSAGVIRRALHQEEAVRDLQERIERSAGFRGIIGRDPKMQTIYRLIEDTAPTDATVLIQGESGTGKELVARATHQLSDRNSRPFVVINCSAYPETLLESELFGHERGAFTGAIRRKAGRFEQANGGTVFLDEIGDVAPQAQIKLLRVLQTQSFERLGGEQTIAVDVRVLAATNRDLLQDVQRGVFREDLFYRLNVIPIYLPPLRERRNDIPLLAKYFLSQFASEQHKNIEGFSPEAMRRIMSHPWPGNVRELENSVEHAVVLAKGSRLEVSDLPESVREGVTETPEPTGSTVRESERTLVEQVLAECGWNKKEAARRLGIGRTTLYAKMKKYRIAKPTLQ